MNVKTLMIVVILNAIKINVYVSRVQVAIAIYAANISVHQIQGVHAFIIILVVQIVIIQVVGVVLLPLALGKITNV